jgi:hypothetical protein
MHSWRVVDRRSFCKAGLAWLSVGAASSQSRSDSFQLVAQTDRARILRAANEVVGLAPQTITAFRSERSPGGLHDFFSQADYFWPDPKNPDGPYVNRDGQSNPANFNDHRKAMIGLSVRMPTLTAAWLLTRDQKFAVRACDHLRAWFITPDTRMNPNLEFSQGVHGVSTGRSYGIIDTLHLVEVARAASHVATSHLSRAEVIALKGWFRSYLEWMQTSDKGKKERDALNNHATCWALQAAEFARLIGDDDTRKQLSRLYIDVLLPGQMGTDGSFPKELERTKPYSYSIFNFDTITMLCWSLTEAGALGVGQDLLRYAAPDGRGVCKAAQFLYPYLKNKGKWPYRKDVEHFDALPVRSPGLLFAGLACDRKEYVELWKSLNPDPVDPEIIRNFPIRQPLLWV